MISIILILFSSILIPGIITRTKSLLAGRKGPSFFQHLRDLEKLFNKTTIYSTSTTFIFEIAPIINLISVLFAMFFLPFGKNKALISFEYDFIVMIYILALGRFFMILAAMDTGSSFEGMGASREALYSLLVEPSFFVILATFCLLSGNTSFSNFISSVNISNYLSILLGLLIVYNIFHILLIENKRLPYDDPKTHLELTMIHEVMILDYSGIDMALINISNYLKFGIYSLIITNFLSLSNLNLLQMILFYLLISIAIGMLIGFIESFRARHKMRQNNKAIVILTPISILIFITTVMLIQKIW